MTMFPRVSSLPIVSTAAALAVLLVAPARAQSDDDAATNSYKVTHLVSDIATMAPHVDPNLSHPGGLSRAPGSPWWVSANNTGVSTLYDGKGNIVPLVVTIPPASGTGTGSPTGTVYHPTLGAFIFVTEDGTISSWAGGASAVIQVNNAATATYTGVTTATRNGAVLLYVANSRGGIEAYDSSFKRVDLGAGAFADSNIPPGFTPYNVQAVGSDIYVTYAGASGGYVDVYDVDGRVEQRLENGAWMSSPWGVAVAPAGFGKFSKSILIGMLTTGRVAAFNAATGKFEGFLHNASGKPVAIPGVWAIFFGDGKTSGPVNSLYFSAGIRGYAAGLFGAITAH